MLYLKRMGVSFCFFLKTSTMILFASALPELEHSEVQKIHSSYRIFDIPERISICNLGSTSYPKIQVTIPDDEPSHSETMFVLSKEDDQISLSITDAQKETLTRKIPIVPYSFSTLWKTLLDLLLSGNATKQGMLLLIQLLEVQGQQRAHLLQQGAHLSRRVVVIPTQASISSQSTPIQETLDKHQSKTFEYFIPDISEGIRVFNIGTPEKPMLKITSPCAERSENILETFISKEEDFIIISINDPSQHSVFSIRLIAPYTFYRLQKTFLDLCISGTASVKGVSLLVKLIQKQGEQWQAKDKKKTS